jgi:hypothetical protein
MKNPLFAPDAGLGNGPAAPAPKTPTTPAPPAVNLADVNAAFKKAADLAKQLAADKYHGASQFAASIRSAIDHGNDLLALQNQWAAANPPKA